MASLDYAYRRLVNTLGPERVARSEFERMVYSHDFASLPKIALLQWRLYPDFVVLPQTTEEVAALVKLSDESLLQITPRGGGTGWCGGSVPNRGGVLVDMRKMNNVLALDPDTRTVTVEAGATWKEVEDFVESKGFTLPTIPLNATGSTVGGSINSGSTGFGGLRGGSVRDAIASLEVILPDGSLLKTASQADAGGQLANLTPLFFGAEGTLGIVTKAVLRVGPKPEVSEPLTYAFHSLAAAARFLKGIVDAALTPYHAALMDRDKLKLNGSVQAHIVDTTTAALDPYVLMDDTKPSGGTALGFVKRMGDAAFKMDGHPMGLGLFLVFNLRKMHGNATSAYSAVKGVFDPRKKINGGKTFEVWTKYPWPGLRSIPPPGMAIGLEAAAILRRLKPSRDRFVRAYEHTKEG